MKAIIDLALLGILIVCAWSGYKKGIIMGLGGILCIIIAIYGANLLANTFSFDVVPALQPFAGGYTEGLLGNKDSKVMKEMGWEDYDYSVDDLIAQYPGRTQEFCETSFRAFGIDERSAERLAQKTMDYVAETDVGMAEGITHTLCETVSYVGCFLLAFCIILIVLTVLGNLPNLSYKLPRFDVLNDIGGTVLGFVTGVIFCLLLVWALKFMGMILGGDTLSATRLGKLFLNAEILPRYLGI